MEILSSSHVFPVRLEIDDYQIHNCIVFVDVRNKVVYNIYGTIVSDDLASKVLDILTPTVIPNLSPEVQAAIDLGKQRISEGVAKCQKR